MSNELTDVRCSCGDEYPADSYDAGFIAGSGMCQNCDAALTPKDICTCPSGDGSLRHPCPAHIGPFDKLVGSPVHNESEPDLPPLDEHLAQVFETGMALSESVEQAGGDERDLQAEGAQGELLPCPFCGGQAHLTYDDYVHDDLRPMPVVECNACHTWVRAESWNKRAALAQPSPVSEALIYACKNLAQITSSDGSGHADIAMAVLRMAGVGDDERERLVNEWKVARAWKPSPAQAEQAEGFTHFPELLESVQQMDAMLKASSAQPEQPEQPEVVGYLLAKGNGTLSILRAGSSDEPVMTVAQHERITAQLHDALDESDGDRWKLRSERDAANARLHEVATACATAEQERDAALARVAELEAKLSDPTAVHQWQFSNAWFDGSEEVVLKAGKEGSPIRTLYAAPVAQAQQLHDLDKQCRDDVARALGLRPSQERGFAWSYLLASIKSCVKASEDAAQAQHSVPEWTSSKPAVEGAYWVRGNGLVEPFVVLVKLDQGELWCNLHMRNTDTNFGYGYAVDDLSSEFEWCGPLAAATVKEVPQAWLDVQAERRRQIEAEGWTPENDDAHSHGQMARAAACYALAGSSAPNDGTAALLVSLAWPWDEQWWKPSTARRDLIKAGALILAEIERLDRAAPGKEGV